jgi:hypothetical protein
MFLSFFQENKIIIATTKASKAIDSIRAKHNIPVDTRSFLADGFLDIDFISEENRFPSPNPTPNKAITDIPAPINFAAATSIFTLLLYKKSMFHVGTFHRLR